MNGSKPLPTKSELRKLLEPLAETLSQCFLAAIVVEDPLHPKMWITVVDAFGNATTSKKHTYQEAGDD